MQVIIHDPRISSKQGGSEVRHALFARYLLECGVQVIIYTLKTNQPSPNYLSLLKEKSRLKIVEIAKESLLENTIFKSEDEEVDIAVRFSITVCGSYRNYPNTCIITSFVPDLIGLDIHNKIVSFFAGLPPSRLIAKKEEKYLNRANKVICVSNYINKIATRYYPNINKQKFITVANGIDPLFLRKQRKNKKLNMKVFYSGRLTQRKGVHFLLKALYKLKNLGFEYSLTIAGDGPYKENLINLCNDLDLDNQVKFLGVMDRESIKEIADASSYFVYPVSKPEGFGNSVLEAMSRGCLVISTALGGISDFLNSSNSIIIKKNNIKDIVDSFIDISSDKKRFRKLVNNGIKTSNEYTQENTFKNYFDILNEK